MIKKHFKEVRKSSLIKIIKINIDSFISLILIFYKYLLQISIIYLNYKIPQVENKIAFATHKNTNNFEEIEEFLNLSVKSKKKK